MTNCRILTSEALLAEIAQSVATVLTTADVTLRSRETAVRHSVPVLFKPFDLDELLWLLRDAHERRRATTRV